MKYIKPQVKVITLSSQVIMMTASILSGDTTKQLGKYRNDNFEDEEYISW